MVSIHTFEIKAFLTGREHKEIKKKLGVPDKRQSWTEHRYNNNGIQIILYKGRSKGFIYIKYIINLKRVLDGTDYIHLLKPTDENLSRVWKKVMETWDEIGCGVPFGRFYLSRVDLTCDVYFETEDLVHEYIRLLNKSILLSSLQKISVEGIYHGKKMTKEMRSDLERNCCKFRITTCEDIQFYNKMYELKKENIPIPEIAIDDGYNILRIELQIHETKRITELLRSVHIYNAPIDEQFFYLIKNADLLLIDRLEKLYTHGDYHNKDHIMDLIENDPLIKKKSKERVIRFIEDCNKNIILGRCLELDGQNGHMRGRKKALRYLSRYDISPIVISSHMKEYDSLPDIFKLVNECSAYQFICA